VRGRFHLVVSSGSYSVFQCLSHGSGDEHLGLDRCPCRRLNGPSWQNRPGGFAFLGTGRDHGKKQGLRASSARVDFSV
jgi:hypothetical protein